MVLVYNLGMAGDLVLSLYQRPETVFSFEEIAMLFREVSRDNLHNILQYACREGHLLSLRKGMYAKPGYRIEEAGNKWYAPSYVSLETVLLREGAIFQLSS